MSPRPILGKNGVPIPPWDPYHAYSRWLSKNLYLFVDEPPPEVGENKRDKSNGFNGGPQWDPYHAYLNWLSKQYFTIKEEPPPEVEIKKHNKIEITKPGERGATIGINLGTAYSSVGVYYNGKVRTLPNERGNLLTPSVVGFNSKGERLIGDAAMNQLVSNSENTVYNFKRFIGREWSDKEVQRDITTYPFKVINKDDKPLVKLQTSLGSKTYAAEELSSWILIKLKEMAERYLHKSVTHAVLTVPAYFNDKQRKATKFAGTLAGLEIVRILNDPIAAAIGYDMDNKHKKTKFLVFDLGAGTFDVSLLTIDGIMKVLANYGDTHLGGEDFNQRVIAYFIKLYKEKKGKDFSVDNRAVQRLRKEVENAKIALSTKYEIRIEIDSFFQGERFSEVLTRDKFEELNKDLFQSMITSLEKVVGKTPKKDITVILVGGSTKIPKIQALVKEFFNGNEPVKNMNIYDAVVRGATAMASKSSGENTSTGIPDKIDDITPLSLGIKCSLEGLLSILIPRGTTIPTTKTNFYTTLYDNQVHVRIQVLEGEMRLAKDNHMLGQFLLGGIRPAPRGTAQILVTFNIDDNNILNVSAKDTENGNTEQITITDYKEQLTPEERARMLKEAGLFN